jgi:hypothetical protein
MIPVNQIEICLFLDFSEIILVISEVKHTDGHRYDFLLCICIMHFFPRV